MKDSEAPRASTLKHAISTFYIEITSACNLACTFCCGNYEGKMRLGNIRDHFKIAKNYYARSGARKLIRKVVSKLTPTVRTP